MKYENAKNILPAKLLEEVQKYAEGKVIYIPKNEKPKGWGEASGYRDRLNKRNAQILGRYSAGRSIMEIAEEFFLSPETVRKLVYGKKVDLPMYSPSIASAEQYAAAGMGEEWVRTYLCTLDEEPPESTEYFMTELVRIPLRFIAEDEENAPENAGYPDVPLIVIYEDREFRTPFQPGYLQSLVSGKRNSFPAFVFAKNEEYGFFWNNYGKHFQR